MSTLDEELNTMMVSNYGKNFFIGFMHNSNRNTQYIRLIISGRGNLPVEFGVDISSGVIYNGTTSAANPITVDLPSTITTTNTRFDRNKGVHVYANGEGEVSVLAINFISGSVGEYLAYPCLDIGGGPYVYFAVSTATVSSSFRPSESEILLVACEDNTFVTITPTQSVNLPRDAQRTISALVEVPAGSNYTVTLNQMQTLLFTARGDLTGTRIVSNKPLTVISGHECANVPASQSYCEHIAEHIPPTSTWGKKFLLVPFGGRSVGQYYKVVASMDETSFTLACNSTPNILLLPTAGSFEEFFTTSDAYCSLISDKSVLVSQLGIGGSMDGIGDPIISIVPPVTHYTNYFSFSSVNVSSFDIHQISVSVLSESFQPGNIRLDGLPIAANWNTIYNSEGTIVGYGCHVSVAGGSVHTVRHDKGSAKLAVMVYGFSSSVSSGYGYLAGLSFIPEIFGMLHN